MEYGEGNEGILNDGCSYEDKLEFSKSEQITILDFYTKQYTHSNREVWKQRIEDGQITVNGDVVSDPDTKITKQMAGKTISYYRYFVVMLL